MKLVGWLATMALAAAPVAAGAHGGGGGIGGGIGGAHAGMGRAAGAHFGPGRDGGAWRGRGFAGNHGLHGHFHGHFPDHFHDRHFHDHGFVWGYPYWGWECGPYSDACDWSDDSDARPEHGDLAYASRPAATDPPVAAAASNECSDWVWRADLHRSICRAPTSRG